MSEIRKLSPDKPMPAATLTFGYSYHPFANQLPMIEGQDFENMKASIRQNGILEPIRLLQGMILDGRNRYAAAKAVGHQFTAKDFREWDGRPEEAEAWVLETQLNRRNLTQKQKQEMVRARIKRSPDMSNRQIAKLLCVSHTMVADERERTANPPEKKKFDQHCAQWEGLPEEYRLEFVRRFNPDLCDYQRVLAEQSSNENLKVSTAG